MITALDHVQLAVPPGTEDVLRAFYTGVLGLAEIPKPPALAARGGCWFGAGPVQLHLGVEEALAGGGRCHCRPARKAHPGLRVTGIEAFAALIAAHGTAVTWDDDLPGRLRFFAHDPVGNRLEFLEPTGPDTPHP
ncbi:VOC family protein [Streptomyces sp. NPDC090108]|uniref:VOC family protein n=1 Tax=Streptomyces sp. NPDC090108 TaxID=3365947 RepID=UPI00382F6E05